METKAKIKMEYLNIYSEELDGDLNDIRNKLSSVDYFSGPGIHIINTQAGTGKSTAIKDQIKNLKKCILFTKSHKIIENEYNILGLRPWKGFKEYDHKYSSAKKLHALGIPIGMICSRCPAKKKCDYNNQFKYAKKVVAPFNYLENAHIYKNNSFKNPFKFENLIVDEDIWETKDLKLDKEQIKESLNAITKYYTNDYVYDKCELFLDELDSINVKRYNDIYLKDLIKFKNTALNHALKKYTGKEKAIMEDIQNITLLRPYEIRKFLYYRDIYGDIDFYPEPNLYHVFDIAREEVPVVLLDATFDEKKFQILLSRYCSEDEQLSREHLLSKTDLKPLHEIKTTIYKSYLKKKDATIYRINKHNLYYKSGFFDIDGNLTEKGSNELKKLENNIKLLKRKYAEISVITTYPLKKEILKKFGSEIDFIEHYRNLKGLNKMKNSDAIILYGTPSFDFKVVLNEYNNFCLTDFKEDNFEKVKYSNKDGKWYDKGLKEAINDKRIQEKLSTTKKIPFYYKFKESNFEEKSLKEFNKQAETEVIDSYLYYNPVEYLQNEVESIIYQALMRARIYRTEGKAPDVFMFCYVPNRVDYEFKPNYYSYIETQNFFETEFKGIYPLVLKKMIDSTDETSKQIASKLKLRVHDGTSLNTKLVTAMMKNSITDIKYLDEGIKRGFTKSGEFKKEYPALKRFNMQSNYSFLDFIKDCIYEAKK